MRILDRITIAVARRVRARRRDKELAAAGIPAERRGTSPVVRAGFKATAATVVVTAALFAGQAYGDARAQAAAESEREFHRAQLDTYSHAVHAKDVCAAEAGAESEIHAGIMRINEAPEIAACDARQQAEAAEIRADTDNRGGG